MGFQREFAMSLCYEAMQFSRTINKCYLLVVSCRCKCETIQGTHHPRTRQYGMIALIISVNDDLQN